jgi:hypothetical protein
MGRSSGVRTWNWSICGMELCFLRAKASDEIKIILSDMYELTDLDMRYIKRILESTASDDALVEDME